MGFDDGSFDLVVSQTVLEHVHDIGAAFREIARVLVPGGLAYHEVEPWFAPRGGHSLCTLDFPWGHVRTTEAEFARYVETFRPLAPDAIRDRSRGSSARA
jgi:ubiquinone/menaquinone biosynthesis C-methylase UbiE